MNYNYLLIAIAFALLSTACTNEPQKVYAGFPKASHLNAKVAGFEVQTISEGTGEWLSIASDPQGRLLVSPRKGDLLRFTIPTDTTQSLKIDTLDIGVKDCQGLLYAYQHLYMMGSHDTIRGIFRVPDADGNGNYGKPQLMLEMPKNGDHSGHTLALGPKGEIYFLTGNDNRVPDVENVAFVYEDWRNDHLMPLTSIFGVNQVPPGGYVLRTDSVGSYWQLTSYGLRNPYDMCFSPEGELFTYDSDMEWDFNLPWYRPTRVNHLVSGGDYAWRQSTAKRFDFYPDILPCTAEFGRGSPTATLFGTGAAFPAKYQNALFLGDWSYGKIYAMFLEPNGATYSATYEPFVIGQPLNITDMIVGQDGALYFTTGGNGTDTGLFRVVYTGKEKTTPVKVTKKLHPNLILRRKLEEYHFAKDTTGLGLALQYIEHEDRFVRYAAKVILERNDPALWQQQLSTATSNDGKITLLTALIRADSTDTYQDLIFDQLNALNFKGLPEYEQLQVLRLYAIAFLRAKNSPKDKISGIYQTLIAEYPATSAILNKELSRVLGYLASQQKEGSETISKTFDLLESTPDPVQFIHYLEVIRHIPNGWSLEQRAAYRHWIRYAMNNLSGGSLFNYFLSEIEKEFEATLTKEERKWLDANPTKPLKENYEGPVKPQPKVVQAVFENSSITTQWKLEDLQYGLELVSSPRNALQRDFNRGQRMFAKGQCYNCHYMINKGGGYGPELTLAGNSFSAEDLLAAILEPSKNINSRFGASFFDMKDGSTIFGRIMSEDDSRYVVQSSYDAASAQDVLKKQIKKEREADVSAMPIGLVNNMNREEIMDLLYFIIQVAGMDKDSLNLVVLEDKPIFERGDSSLVEMVNFSNRGKIHYTLDGSEPTSSTPVYEAPFFVNKSTCVKAKLIDGKQFGKTITRYIHSVDRKENGLDWKLYRNVKTPFNVAKNQQPDATGVNYTFEVRSIAEAENNFEIHFDGYLQIDATEEYKFYTSQDDAMKLYIDNKLVVDASKSRWESKANSSIRLTAGKHAIRVEFYDNLSFEYLDIEYESKQLSRRRIFGDKLYRSKPSI